MTFSQAVRRCGTAAAVAVTCALSGGGTAVAAPPVAHLTKAERAKLLAVTGKFRDVQRAIDAGYLPTKDCVPGMGLHYVNPAYAGDGRIDPLKPEILLYLAGPHGRLKLTAVEYFLPDGDGDLNTDRDRPALYDHPFNGPMLGHPVPQGAPPMPVHYDLHVWLYRHNPAGELATENPTVTCG
ncbi:hypothetical protein [Paractinoplanes durhamensis]|uniref:Uncharacterized protein n=1 Tax=Paractinoplanes durhamensis TaxID=113563 RepID=A0ABQ3Z397_9ACTN|nr:hypothetical protein [Actinoplanes durhamensis]GIE04305.1 hypothetical protein Adu01nite_56550 [Actinoplanes durhamensis]